MWPICFDSWGLSEKQYIDNFYKFDVWRIDTLAIKNTWYIDPNLIHSAVERPGEATDYLYTDQTVAPIALKLFTISLTEYGYHYNNKLKCEFILNPVDEINDIIYHKWKKKNVVR